jgi:hypothetical protein
MNQYWRDVGHAEGGVFTENALRELFESPRWRRSTVIRAHLAYVCWARNIHPLVCVPQPAKRDSYVQFICDCMGSLADDPRIRPRLLAGEEITVEQAMNITAFGSGPPRYPTVRLDELTPICDIGIENVRAPAAPGRNTRCDEGPSHDAPR